MLLNKLRTITRKLNEIRFVGLVDYDIGSAVSVPISRILSSSIGGKEVFKSLVNSVFFQNYKYNFEINPEAKIFFLFSHSYANRNDQRKLFYIVTSILRYKDILVAHAKHKTIDKKGVFLALFIPLWLIQMRKINIGIKGKLYLISQIVESKRWISSNEFGKVSTQKYRLFVTFCDAHTADNIMAQYFKKNGVLTSTLQHGWYRKSKSDAADFSKIELGFEGFVCDKFLIWGDYIRKNAIHSGLNSRSLVSLGHPKYIDYKVEIKKHRNNVFGIILGRSKDHCKEENMELLKYANIISKEFDYKYVVKYHPGDSENEIVEYESLIDPDYLFLKYDKNTTIDEYVLNVEFSIVGSTSVFADLMYMGEIAFRYTYINDDYEDLEWGKFSNQVDLMDLINAYQKDKTGFRQNTQEIGQMLCGSGDIASNYRNFFSAYMI